MKARSVQAFLSLLLAASINLRAAAAEVPRVALSVSNCPGISADEVRRITAVELRLPVFPPEVLGPSATLIAIRCDGETAQLSLIDRVTEKSLQRSVDLHATQALAEPRLLALSVAELVSASWAELELASAEPARRPADVTDARAVVEARTARRLEGDVQLLGSVRAWSSFWISYGSALRLQLGRSLGKHSAVLLASGIGYEGAQRSTDAGDVSLALFDAELAALVEARLGSVRFATGGGLRAGLLRATGEPRDPTRVLGHSAQDAYWGPLGQLRGTWAPNSPLRASIGLESGWTARAVNVRVLGAPTASAGQVWISVMLGMGVRL